MNSIKIDIEKSDMISTFASETFYESWKVFMRELLQNAMDSCNTKQALEWSWGTEFLEMEQADLLNSIREPYDAQILINYDSKAGMLSIEDNGIGINEHDVVNYLSKIGKSYYTSEDYLMQRLDYEPVSKHGIGLCSCFMVARALLIDSKKDKAVNTAWNVMEMQDLEPIMIKWFEAGSEIEYVPGSRKESGTKITLPIKPAYTQLINMDFLLWSVLHYTMYQPIPITITVDGKKKVLHQKEMEWRFPHTELLGATIIKVDDDMLEGYIAVYNQRHKGMFGESEIFQQNIRVTDHVETLDLRPHWLDNFTYQLNIKHRLLNMNYNRSTAARDDKLEELRQRIGQILIDKFGSNPIGMGQFLSDGRKSMLSEYELETELISRAVIISVFLKGRSVDVTIKTVINGFMGRKIKVALMSRGVFDYYIKNYPHEFKSFLVKYDMIVFDNNARVFVQFMSPYIENMEYIVSETPGVVYTVFDADMRQQKEPGEYRNSQWMVPKGCESPNVFCLIYNDQTEPFEIVLNPYNRNAALLIEGEKYEKVRELKAVIIENIKKRIISSQTKWDKILDFGGEAVEDYTLREPVSVQSIWCLEKEFPMAVNEFAAQKLTPREVSEYGLLSLYFSEDDFISWWLPPV